MRKAEIRMYDKAAGILTQNEEGFTFVYLQEYIHANGSEPVSITLPVQVEPYNSKTMFPFFDGLILEGWLLEIAEKNWKLDYRDRMGLLLVCCRDCIGAVSVYDITEQGADEPS